MCKLKIWMCLEYKRSEGSLGLCRNYFDTISFIILLKMCI